MHLDMVVTLSRHMTSKITSGLTIGSLLLILILVSGCKSAKSLQSSALKVYFSGANPLFNHFVGFKLLDPESGNTVYSYNEDKLFTPASNTKILTLFAAMQCLEDSLLNLKSLSVADTTYIWGMGDPTTLHPAFSMQDYNLQQLKNLETELVFCTDHWESARYGAGWAWDDYPYYYQVERSFWPMYGNVVWFEKDSSHKRFSYFPNPFPVDIRLEAATRISRLESQNQFDISLERDVTSNRQYQVPYKTGKDVFRDMMSTELGRTVKLSDHCPVRQDLRERYSIPVDSVFSYFMKYSDNFIAEQLLLMCAGKLFDTLDIQLAIDHLMNNHFRDYRDEIIWRDGSGLSRYNLISPNAITQILLDLLNMQGFEHLKNIFPAGGQSGTLSKWYQSDDGIPYIYAKSGTLSNIHCLSGYIQCDSGKVLIFSFMHANYRGSSSRVKPHINTVLKYIKKNY